MTDEIKRIHIDLSDIAVPTETARENAVREVSNEAKKLALERMQSVASLGEYMLWNQAASFFFTPPSIDWMWQYGGTTPQELVKEREDPNNKKYYEENAKAAEDMRIALQQLPPKDGMVRVALKRVRDEQRNYTYRVLAAFDNQAVSDPLDEVLGYPQSKEEAIIFFEPINACVSHPCDLLYKKHRTQAFYIPFLALDQITQQLHVDERGIAEFVLSKTDNGVVTQDEQKYLLYGLQGGFSNEPLRTRVSDFWQ